MNRLSAETIIRGPRSESGGGRDVGIKAFTLLELLVVIAIIGLLAALLLPALSSAKQAALGARCRSNEEQIMSAWTMYADDFHGYMVPNSPIGATLYTAWVDSVSGLENWGYSEPPSSGNTNIAVLRNALLAPYLSGQIGVYKCPADRLPSANGPRLRSISMNAQMGAEGQTPETPPGNNNAPGLLFSRIADLVGPTPSLAIVFLDESMATLQDGYLQIDTHGDKGYFPDIPANYHAGGCGMGYADGHSEVHKWNTAPLLSVPYNQSVGYPSFVIQGMNANNADWQWWIQRVDLDQD